MAERRLDREAYIRHIKEEQVRPGAEERARIEDELEQILKQCPQEPAVNYDEKAAMRRLAVAQTYLDAADRMIYSGGGLTFLSGESIWDDEHDGRGNIDCSTFVLLVLSGITYGKSPYVTGELPSETDALYDIRYASELAEYFWKQGRCRWHSCHRW